MKRFVIFAFFALILLIGTAHALKTVNVDQPENIPSFLGYVQDEFIVKLKPGVAEADLGNLVSAGSVAGMKKQFPGSSARPVNGKYFDFSRFYKVKVDPGSLDQSMAAFRNSPNVESVEKIAIHSVLAMPNDGNFSEQWHLNQLSDVDMDAPEAWDIETGDATIVVAIMDTGIRYFHKDLGGLNASYTDPTNVDGNMWVNWAEKNGTPGVDDDGNGYVDDWVGWDWVDATSSCWSGEDCDTPDNDPRDFNGHGTHCAGNVAAINNNGYATCATAGGWGDGTLQPTANGVKVMACRIGWSAPYIVYEVGYVRMDFAAEAFYYAAENGANIASCSWGSSYLSSLESAINYFLASGGMIFKAAGNDGSQTADYMCNRTDIISVAATDSTDCKADFSTYGTWVDVSAPGTGILSSYHSHDDPASDYVAAMDGTSMATPLSASVAALIWSRNPGWTASQVEQQLYSSADDIYGLSCNSAYAGKLGAGRVNAFNAVNTGTPPPVAAFTGSPTSGCAPLSVSFTDQSTGDITSWSWDFGDGGSSTAQNLSYTYNNSGTYTVTLTVTGPGGSDNEVKTDYIAVSDVPAADFSGSPTTGTAPLTVDFTDLSSGNPTSWSWDFGDGGGSTSQDPSYTYNTAGTYTVVLTATNACGSDAATKVDYITVDPCVPPTADFSGSPTSGTVPLAVNFTDLSTGASSWSWDFGDGGSSTAQNPSHTYNSEGTYTVVLTATNACGSDVATKVDYITVEPPMNLMAFALSDIPVVGTVTGDYTATYASDNNYEVITEVSYGGHPRKTYSYLEHKWSFEVSSGSSVTFFVEAYRPNNADGDDFAFEYSTDNVNFLPLLTVASASEQVYSAALPSATSGTVYIRVTDTDRSWGNSSYDPLFVDQMYIEIVGGTPQPPVAEFSGDPTAGVYPLTVQFTDLSTNSPTSWSWNFGDGGTSTAQNPSHTYNNIGTYTVTLVATNDYGSDTNTKTGYITVTDASVTMHVHDIAVTRVKSGPNYLGEATIYVYDSNEQPVSGAIVYATATGPTGGNFSGATDSQGMVVFQTSGMKKPSGEWCFEVTDVTHTTMIYDPNANHVTQACESGPVYKMGDQVTELIPTEFELHQNRPNPFNPTTNIGFSLPEASHVQLDIYNILGQRVITLVNRYYQAGIYTVTWDASRQPSGIYFYRIITGDKTAQSKMLLLK